MIKKIIKNITILLVIFLSLNNTFAKYILEPKIEKLVSNFLIKIEKKYSPEKEVLFLENINSKINTILEKKKLNTKKTKLLNDILVLFNERIFKLDYEKSLDNISQPFIEAKLIETLKNNLSKINIPEYLKDSKNKIIRISKKQEFVENNEIKRLNLTKYYSVNSNNFRQFKNKE
jgi:hypothetical protein